MKEKLNSVAGLSYRVYLLQRKVRKKKLNKAYFLQKKSKKEKVEQSVAVLSYKAFLL